MGGYAPLAIASNPLGTYKNHKQNNKTLLPRSQRGLVVEPITSLPKAVVLSLALPVHQSVSSYAISSSKSGHLLIEIGQILAELDIKPSYLDRQTVD